MRLTKKCNNDIGYGYKEYSSEGSKATTLKLGQLEDILEKYAITDLEQLDRRLKDYEVLKIDLLKEASENDCLKLALEIIKETGMLSVLQDWRGIYYLVVNNSAIEISKEEYDLLKEVLSDER